MYRLKEHFDAADSAPDYVARVAGLMAGLVRGLDAGAVGNVIEIVERAVAEGRSIVTFGNGGSAVVASHFVNDLGVNSLVDGKPGCRVYCLADNAASVTAVANDVSYEDVFRRQLQCHMGPGDVVVAMSVSGNSENVVRAVQFANEQGGITVGFCGFDGGRLARAAQQVVHVKATGDEYGPVEDMFSIVCHLVSSYVTMRRGRYLHH